MTDKQKADLIHLVNELQDRTKDYGHARGNNTAYRMARSKAGLYFADAMGAAMNTDAAFDELIRYIAEL